MPKPPKAFHSRTPAPDPVLAFGKHKGSRLSGVARSYLEWLADPGTDKSGKAYAIPADVVAAAAARLAADSGAYAAFRLSGQTHGADDPTMYVVEDVEERGLSAHRSLDEALAAIADGSVRGGQALGDAGGPWMPDPEDDRILVHEVLPSGHRKVVWHFSGWHHDKDEFGLPQGALPGCGKSLREMSEEDGNAGDGWG